MSTEKVSLLKTTQIGIKKNWDCRELYEPDVTIVVALFNGLQTGIPHSVGIYDESWVDKLYRGIEKNYTGKFDFVCLTDQNYKFKENVRSIRFTRSVDQYGWMSLMEWYHPDLCKGRRVTMGLDTIITGPLDDIFNWDVDKVAVCQDPYHPRKICNAMTIVTPEFCDEIWNYWLENEYQVIRECELLGAPSEMVLLRQLYSHSPRLDTIFKGRILSYKVHIKDHWERVKDSSIIYFHGEPKPHQIDEKWIKENWI